LAEINAAEPVFGNLDRGARFPLTIAHTLFTGRWVGLNLPFEWLIGTHQPSALAAVISHAINIQRERRRRIRADVKADRISGPNTRPRAVALNPQTTILRLQINPRVGEHPVARAGLFVLAANQISLSEN